MKLAKDLYAYVWKGKDNNCNSFLFAAVLPGKKHLLIDPGHVITPYLHEAGFDRLVAEIVKDGLKVEDIGMVALTHAHPDHIEAAPRFKSKSGALIALHADDATMYQRFGLGKPDLILEEGDLKATGAATGIVVYRTPGHSPGEVSFYWPEKKALAVGDVIFFQNTGRVDLPGGNPALLKDSIDRLAELDVEYLLCGHPYGHPGVIQGKEAIRQNFEFVKENIFG
jgi:hydroxyacylglutathione hydrolase